MTPRLSMLAVVVSAAVAATHCYSDPINTAPTVSINVPPHIGRNQETTFSATAIDPGDSLRYHWSSGPGPCPTEPATLPHGGDTSVYTVQLLGDADGDACVRLTVTDPYGASASDQETVVVENQAPTAHITVQQPSLNAQGQYDLYSTFRLSSAASQDPNGDGLTPAWAVAGAPTTASVTLVPCSPDPPADRVVCFGPVVVSGTYQIALVVSDGRAESAREPITLVVAPDRPPCITDIDPKNPEVLSLWDPAVGKTFTVRRVDDDGDRWPPGPLGAASFSWSLRRNDDSWQAITGFETLSEVTISGGSFVSGDRLAVRVEVKDRQPAHDLTGCGDLGVCPADCPRRITWTVDYQ